MTDFTLILIVCFFVVVGVMMDVFIEMMVCLLFINLGLIYYTKSQESEVWEQHKSDHKCKIVREISDSFPFTPRKTCWECDDGVEYCR